MALSTIDVAPRRAHKASVIWLHGLGADGHDFDPVVPELQLPDELGVRFIFPNAPSIPVTINGGMVMPAWYDILSIGSERGFNAEQLQTSAAEVQALIDAEIDKGIASNKIVLAGFSQGGAVNFEAGLTYPKPLAGLLALSTYFPTAHTIETHPANAQIPIQVYHGTFDPMVPEALARASVDTLTAMGYNVAYKSYPMEHSLCMEEIEDIGAWLRRVLG